MKRFAIFIDGSNVSAASKLAGYRIDYEKVRNYWLELGEVIDCRYFTALPPKDVMTPLRSLTDWLSYHNWKVETKETKDHLSSEGLFKFKGNMDIEIAVRALALAQVFPGGNNLTDLVLFSGDGDFTCLVDELQRRGVKVTVVSYHNSKNSITSDDLRRQADAFINLAECKHLFQKLHGKKECR